VDAAGRDRHVAHEIAGRGAAGRRVAGVRVVADRARRRRIAGLAGFDHAVAAGRLAVVVVGRVATAGATAVAVDARGLLRGDHALRLAGAAVEQRVEAAALLRAIGRAGRQRIAVLAGLDDAVATHRGAVDVVGRVAHRRAAVVGGLGARRDRRAVG